MTGLTDIRRRFPGLSDGWSRFDGPAGTQAVDTSIEAVADWQRSGNNANSHGAFPAARECDALADRVSATVGELLGVDPAGMVFGPSTTANMMALTRAIAADLGPGDEIICTELDHDSNLAPWLLAARDTGATVRMACLDPDSGRLHTEAVVDLIGPATRWVAVTGASNAIGTIPDTTEITGAAHAAGARVVVDNTFATPVLQRPLELGADVVVHSTTKFINGFGTVIGGAVVSADAELMAGEIASLIRFTGGVPSPFDCWLTNLGLKTLPLRMERHCNNAMVVAEFLESHPAVDSTAYPGLGSHPQHDLAQRQMDGFGALIAFDLGDYGAATRFLDRIELCALAVSLGNVDTLVEHPASMTHAVVPAEARAASGITDGLIRISVGLEDVDDIVADLDRALGG